MVSRGVLGRNEAESSFRLALLVAPLVRIVVRMDAFPMVVGALTGLVAGWVFPAYQYLLYSEAEFRAAPAAGRRLLLLRLFSMSAAGGALALAFRPDFYEFGPTLLTAAFLLVLVALSSTDFDRRRIPNKLTYPAFLVAVALCWAWPDRTVGEVFIGIGVGVAAAVLLVGVGILVGGGGMGLGIGDGKLMIVMGALVGWPGIMSALFYGILAAGLVSVVLLIRRGRGAAFSYGPYLAAGAGLLLLFPDLR